MEKNNKYFVIVDSNSVIHRAFHALPPLKNKEGQVVNAVYGFLLILFKIINEFNPQYLVACFDRPEPTIRKNKFADYKAKRAKAPQELYDQIPLVKDILQAFSAPIFEMPGYEGDDLIGTLSCLSVEKDPNLQNIIVSGDNDIFQLVNNKTNVYYLKKGVKDTSLYGEEYVFKKFGGLSPLQIIDYKALKGDQSDNIPGVPGIGEKTAIDLISRFQNLNGVYQALDKGEIKESIKEKLINNKESAYLSYELAQIITNAPIEIKDINCCEWRNYDKDVLVDKLLSLGFKSLISKIPHENNMESFIKEGDERIGSNLKLW